MVRRILTDSVCIVNFKCSMTGEVKRISLVGKRHYCSEMIAAINQYEKLGMILLKDGDVQQGFQDQFGKYYDRKEAYRLAEDNGQLMSTHCSESWKDEPKLYSEDLW